MKKVTREEAMKSPYYDYFLCFNMPLSFIAADLDDYDTSWLKQGNYADENFENFDRYLEYINNIGDMIDRGLGLFISGSFGVGKTMLEVIALKRAIDYFIGLKPDSVDFGFTIGYTTGEELVGLFSYDDNESSKNRRSKLRTIDVLSIDELTRVPLTASAKEKVFIEGIIRSRAFNLLSTIITSQANIDELGRDMSPALPELLREYFSVCNFVAPSWRENYGKK